MLKDQNHQILIIETTVSKHQEAIEIANKLLDQKLIACANISKIDSIYKWQNKNHQETEFLISIKTTETNKQDTIESIKSQHPYELPMILIKKVETTKEYANWVKDSLK